MLVEYKTFKNGEETHFVEIEVDDDIDLAFFDTREGTEQLNRKVSEAVNLPIGSFKLGSIQP